MTGTHSPDRRRVLLAAGSVATVALAGCLGGDDDGDESAGSTGEPFDVDREGDFDVPTDPEESDFLDRTGEDVVEVETREREAQPQFVFDAPFVRVDGGTTVRWINGDGVFHTMTSTPDLDQRQGGGDRFEGVFGAEGDTWERTFGETGTHDYYCEPHSGFMYGSIDVV